MTEWQKAPFTIQVRAGETKAFCMCGNSRNGPFCDGSHAGTEHVPEVVTFDTDRTIHACGCQHSKNRPYCDGSHARL
ncbi:MAG: CDGSH iron-sulfur domain-containing protein [Leptospirillia bacterium]